MLYYEHARLKKKLSRILEKHSALSHKLKSVVMGDLATRYDMIFEDSDKKFHYVHESCRLGRTLVCLINEYENKGYRLVFHVMGDLATRHELFFEKEVWFYVYKCLINLYYVWQNLHSRIYYL